MINKRNLWFLTLFSLILVLSVYYVTMPSELLMIDNNYVVDVMNEKTEPTVEVNESTILTALRIEEEEKVSKEIEELQAILVNSEKSAEEKNNAYEKIKGINNIRNEEQKLEQKIQDAYSLKSFVKIDGDQIRVVISSDTHDNALANNIIRLIQDDYEKEKYISVKFQI